MTITTDEPTPAGPDASQPSPGSPDTGERESKASAATTPSRSNRTSARMLRQGIAAFAAFAVFLAVFVYFGTRFTHNREQAALQRDFRNLSDIFGLPPQFTTNADGTLGAAKPIATGAPVAWLRIPDLGVSEVVVEGTTSSQTLRGPGHVRSTPLPGQFGNSVIICRRVAAGAPCAELDQLEIGDSIKVTTAFGDITYKVFASGVADADNRGIFNTLTTGTGEKTRNIDTLTLVTSNPAVVSSARYVVQAELQGQAKNFTPSKIQVTAAELGLQGESGAWLPLVLALQFLLVSAIGAVWLAKTWNRRAAWIIATPVVLCAMWLTCEQFIRVIPASL